MMRRFRALLVLAACAMAMTTSGFAQDQTQAPPSDSPAAAPLQTAPPSQAPPIAPRQWMPEGIAALGQGASSRTEFTLDHSMLVLASQLDKSNDDLRRVIAGVNGVSVHSFRFPGAILCDPAIMDWVNRQYSEAGWQHLVNKRSTTGGPATDLWIHLDQASIRDVAVLFVRAKELDFISVSGSITPLDLLHLSGHFGIPKMDGGAIVPDR